MFLPAEPFPRVPTSGPHSLALFLHPIRTALAHAPQPPPEGGEAPPDAGTTESTRMKVSASCSVLGGEDGCNDAAVVRSKRRGASQSEARRERRRRWASEHGEEASRAVLSVSMWRKRAWEMAMWRRKRAESGGTKVAYFSRHLSLCPPSPGHAVAPGSSARARHRRAPSPQPASPASARPFFFEPEQFLLIKKAYKFVQTR